MGRVEGKVAFVTGAARGQGRSHSVRLAEEGADIIAIDLCGPISNAKYQPATEADLDDTARLVEKTGRRVLHRRVDVRDLAAMTEVVADGVEMFGRLDIVVANAGIGGYGPLWEVSEESFQETIDIDLGGVWKTIKATVPHILRGKAGGSIILTSSVMGLVGFPNAGTYCAAKHGVVGLMRALAVELAPHSIRVNTVNPSTVDTPMVMNENLYTLFSGGKPNATFADAEPALRKLNAMPVAALDVTDISNAVLYLASDESRFITGTTHVIDAGATWPSRLPTS